MSVRWMTRAGLNYRLPLVRRLPLDPEQRLVVNRGFENYIAIRPLDEWYRITAENQQIKSLCKEKTANFNAIFTGGLPSFHWIMPSRILLPKNTY